MPKKALKIERFEGGINTHLHKKDIPDNSFEVADNAMFDVVGKIRPGGNSEFLGIDDVVVDAEAGYGLFSFSHDFSNPDTTTEISKNTNIDDSTVGGGAGDKHGRFNEEDGSVLQVATQVVYLEMNRVLSAAQESALSDSLDSTNNFFDFVTSSFNNVVTNGFSAGNGASFVNGTSRGKLKNESASQGFVTLPITTIIGKNYTVHFDVIAVSGAQINVSLGDSNEYNSDNSVTSGVATDVTLTESFSAQSIESYLALQLTTSNQNDYVEIDNLKIRETNAEKFKLTDGTVPSNPTFYLWNDDPIGTPANNGWQYDTTNRLVYCKSTNTLRSNYAVSQIAETNKTYFISVLADGDEDNTSDPNTEEFSLGTGYIFVHGGVSIEDGQGVKTLSPGVTSGIFRVPGYTNGNIGVKGTKDFIGRVHSITVYEVPSARDTSYILQQNNRYIQLLDTSLESWRTGILPLRSSDLFNVKPQYYVADGTLRVYNASFGETSENKWYGFIERQNFLDTTVSSVDGSVQAGTSSSGSFIRQWVEEDQRIYAPSSNSHNESVGYTGDGNPGKAALRDEGSGNFDYHSTGIQILIGTASVSGGTYDSSYHYYLSYLYDDSEQESPLFILNTTADAGTDGYALYVAVTVNVSNTNGYAFNKRIVGARLYYNDITDSEGFKYHLLDIDFQEGCRKFDDVVFKAWDSHPNSDSVTRIVQCPEDSCESNRPATNPELYFAFEQMPKVTTYDMINGYSPDEDTYFRYKTAVIAMDKLWAGNIGEVSSSNVITDRFSDRIIISPRGRFDLLPKENFLDVVINDGDEIIKLESMADRLLVFKRKMLYIINVGKDDGEYIEAEHRFLGISHHASVVKTEGGIAWVNARGVFVYDGQQLVNLIENKINADTWREYVQIEPLIGFIPHKKQLFVLREASSIIDSSFYMYDFRTKSWSKNLNGMGTFSKSNIINAEDSTESFNGNPIYSTIRQVDAAETVIINQSLPGTTGSGYTASGSVTPNALAVAQGVINQYAEAHISVGWSGQELYSSIGSSTSFIFYYGASDLAINSSGVVTAGGGIRLTPLMPTTDIINYQSVQAVTIYLTGKINSYTTFDQGSGVTSGYTANMTGSTSINIIKNVDNTTDNTKIIRWAHNGTGSYVLQTSSYNEFDFTTITGGASPVNHVAQIGIAGVTDGANATVNRFGFDVTGLNPYDWVIGAVTPEGNTNSVINIEHIGGSDTSEYSDGDSGDDTTNEEVANDLRAITNGNSLITGSLSSGDGLGITVSAVADAGSFDDVNGDDIFYFSLSSAKPFLISETPTYLYQSIKQFTNENSSIISGYKIITKEFDFGQPSVEKKIYKIYITFRNVNADGNYFESGVKVYYGIDGKDITAQNTGTEFSAADSKYYSSSGGLTAFDSSSDLNTTLSSIINSTTQGASGTTDIDFTDGSNIMKNGVIQIDSEQMLITADMDGNSTTDDTVIRGYYNTTPATHSNGAEVLVARTDQYVTAELKPSSSINNVKSFQLKLESFTFVPAKFEVNDITVVYRMKNIK